MQCELRYNKIESDFYILPSNLDSTNSSFIYGEVCAKDIIRVLKDLNIEGNINFVDIGSGCGKLVIDIANNFKDSWCTGIEIHQQRYAKSIKLLDNFPDILGTTEFSCTDFQTIYFGNYDVLYCCNTIFSKEDNKKLYNKILGEFSGYVILFNWDYCMKPYLLKSYRVNTSWEKSVEIFVFYI